MTRTENQKSIVRHVATSVISGVVVAGIIGGIGYVTVITRLQVEIESLKADVSKQDAVIEEMRDDREGLTATLEGLKVELRNVNENLRELTQRLRDQENRSYQRYEPR